MVSWCEIGYLMQRSEGMGMGPSRDILRDCTTWNFAKVRLQLYNRSLCHHKGGQQQWPVFTVGRADVGLSYSYCHGRGGGGGHLASTTRGQDTEQQTRWEMGRALAGAGADTVSVETQASGHPGIPASRTYTHIAAPHSWSRNNRVEHNSNKCLLRGGRGRQDQILDLARPDHVSIYVF